MQTIFGEFKSKCVPFLVSYQWYAFCDSRSPVAHSSYQLRNCLLRQAMESFGCVLDKCA